MVGKYRMHQCYSSPKTGAVFIVGRKCIMVKSGGVVMENQNSKFEAKIITTLPEYKDAFINYFQDTTRTFMSLKNELLSGIGTVSHEGPARMRTSAVRQRTCKN